MPTSPHDPRLPRRKKVIRQAGGAHPYTPPFRQLPAWAANLLVVTFYMALWGYEAWAPLIQLVSGEGSTPSLILRAFVVLLCGLCLGFFPRSRIKNPDLIPLYIFLILYTIRMFENFYIRQYVWHATPEIVFGFLIGASLIPAYVLSGIIVYLPDRFLSKYQFLVIGIFFLGLGLNAGSLIDHSQTGRLSIDKLNPILLGATALSFALLLLLTPSKNLPMTVARYGTISALVGLAAFTQSRGPILATGSAVLIFGLIARGKHRKYLVRAIIIIVAAGVAASVIYGFDILDVALGRFSRDAVGRLDISAQGRIAAWSASWLQFLDSPLIGDRVFEPTLLRYPHNLFLESLISIGVFGSVFLVLHLWLAIKKTSLIFKDNKSSLLSKYIGLIFIKTLIEAQFSGSVWTNNTLWVASACLLGTHIAVNRNRR